MVITYLIGNGFDIGLGLNTQADTIITAYRDSLAAEIDEHPDKVTLGLKALSKSLNQDYDRWSDFEHAIGTVLSERCAEEPDPSLAYQQALEHFVSYLFAHIEKENKLVINTPLGAEQLKRFQKGSSALMADGLRPKQAAKLTTLMDKHEKENWEIQFISFNYTTLLDRLISETSKSPHVAHGHDIGSYTYRRTLHEPLHIHGVVTDDHAILVGVDDVNQISVKELAELEAIQRTVIKPMLNEEREDLAQERALELISKSTVICVFGMSLGESDQTWWKALGEWLDKDPENRLLVISNWFTGRDVIPATRWNRIQTVRNTFLDRAGIQDAGRRNLLESSILVSENTKAFDLGITIKHPKN